MSADFRTCLIRDSRLGITDELTYGVQSGGSNCTYQQYQAITATASNMVFNCQIPSESIVINREILLQSTLSLQLRITNVQVGETAFQYGVSDAFQAFPLAKLMTTLTATINNCNVSVNLQDVIDPLLRMNDSRELYRYNGMTPTLPDQMYQDFATGIGANNNPLADASVASYDLDQMPRGAFPAQVRIYRYATGADAVATDQSPVSTNVANVFIVDITALLTEPLFLSPIIFGDPCYNMQGFSGVNTMNFVANIDSTCKRAFSTANHFNANGTERVITIALGCDAQGQTLDGVPAFPAVQPFVGTRLLFNFLSTQASDLVPVRNVLPYLEYPRYLSLSTNNPAIADGASATISSQNIQLNQIPDYFLIYARIPMSSQKIWNSASFLPINSISCNFNNASGLLASATAQDLWRISVANGSTQSWLEFGGKATSTTVPPLANPVPYAGSFTCATTGSLLILAPAYNLSLADYLSSGSIGQYLFQFNINVSNNTGDALQPEIVVVCVNSGVFTTVSGSSNIYTGLLTKQMVLDAKEKRDVRPVEQAVYRRMIGGKMGHHAMSSIRRMPMISSKHLAVATDAMEGMGHSGGSVSRKGLSSRLHKYV